MTRPQFRTYFRPEDVCDAKFVNPPGFAQSGKKSGRMHIGIRYERAAHVHNSATLGDQYLASPWIEFRVRGDSRRHWCQPDALYFDLARGQITIIEIKYAHCADAWFQLNRVYLPVLQQLFPPGLWKFATLEMVKWFDCATSVPETPKLRDGIARAMPNEFGVFIWKPRVGER